MVPGAQSANPPRVLAAPDKFRGTATAAEIAAAIGRAARAAGWQCDEAPVADGGEGTLDALGRGGAVRHTRVRGPLGEPVVAEWRMAGDEAVVEMARASGLGLAGGAAGNDALRATTYGTGELIAAAIDAGARRVVVAMGGSATTDGGLAALTAMDPLRRLRRGVELVGACDVSIPFVEAAERFGPQKGATPAQVHLLRRRLERLAQIYEHDYGVDVRHLPGAGAAGGLAGGLAAAGATLVPGFTLVAEALSLSERVAAADLVVTGEGAVDAETFAGKAVGEVIGLARRAGVPAMVIAGRIDEPPPEGADLEDVELHDLTARFGPERAAESVLTCVETLVAGRFRAQERSR